MTDPAEATHLHATLIETQRLSLEPLSRHHAYELVDVLDDPSLHTYIGGEPATLEQLLGRFELKSGGISADGVQTWLNWVIRTGDGTAVGFVQATITPFAAGPTAELAWVVGVSHQRRGFATEAAAAVTAWLAERHVRRLVAHVHPQNLPSQVVAQRLGLQPTDVVVEGETEWVRPAGQAGASAFRRRQTSSGTIRRTLVPWTWRPTSAPSPRSSP